MNKRWISTVCLAGLPVAILALSFALSRRFEPRCESAYALLWPGLAIGLLPGLLALSLGQRPKLRLSGLVIGAALLLCIYVSRYMEAPVFASARYYLQLRDPVWLSAALIGTGLGAGEKAAPWLDAKSGWLRCILLVISLLLVHRLCLLRYGTETGLGYSLLGVLAQITPLLLGFLPIPAARGLAREENAALWVAGGCLWALALLAVLAAFVQCFVWRELGALKDFFFRSWASTIYTPALLGLAALALRLRLCWK